MKKVLLSSLALCLTVSSCSNNDLLNSQMSGENTPMAQIAIKDTPRLRKARAVAFVGQNPNLFGSNVMIFESYAELDTTLNHIQEMDHKALRAWATENNVQNDILESTLFTTKSGTKRGRCTMRHPKIYRLVCSLSQVLHDRLRVLPIRY